MTSTGATTTVQFSRFAGQSSEIRAKGQPAATVSVVSFERSKGLWVKALRDLTLVPTLCRLTPITARKLDVAHLSLPTMCSAIP